MAAASGTARSRIAIAPRDKRIDVQFFRRLLRIVRLYWWGRHSWKPYAMLAVTFGASAASGLLGGMSTLATGAQMNALVGHDIDGFWAQTVRIMILMLAMAAIGLTSGLIAQGLVAHWRRWFTADLIDRYLARRAYYDITVDQDIDNPDQRMQEEVEPLCDVLIQLPRTLFSLSFTVSIQAAILYAISPSMTFAVLAFIAAKIIASLYMYRAGVGISWDIKIAEADLRYGLLHVRDNAETIAFYRGENAERQHLGVRLAHAIRQKIREIVYNLRNQLFLEAFDLAWFVLPLLFVIPLYLSGHIAFGAIAQAATAAMMLKDGLNNAVNLLPTLSAVAPNIVRLTQIIEKTDALADRHHTRAGTPRQEWIDLRRGGDALRLTDLSYQTPGGELSLARHISFMLRPGQRLLVTGQTGVGKSSFLRVLAGLWTRGQGLLETPALDRAMFMPQKPYMVLGTLRSQILYPGQQDATVTDAAIMQALARVRLPDLAARHGGLDAEKDWARILSLGEQQRIGFARFLINCPDYAFLDEATSAVDYATEAHLYQLLIDSGTTLVSVAHRVNVAQYHDLVLDLRQDGWTIGPVPADTISPLAGQPSTLTAPLGN